MSALNDANPPGGMPVLLVFELRMMGDAVMSLPFIRAARERFRVVVCCTPPRREVFETILPPERVIAWNPPWIVEEKKYAWKRWREASWSELITQLRAWRADIALTVWPDTRVHFLMALCGARQRIGFPMNTRNYYGYQRPERRKQMVVGKGVGWLGSGLLLRRLLTHSIDRHDYHQHHVENWRQLAESLSLPWNTDTPWLPADSASASLPAPVRAVCDAAKASGQKSWAWHVGARLPSHRWPMAKIEQVVRSYFLAVGKPLLLIASAEDTLPPSLAELAPVARPQSFRGLCDVMHAVDYVVCNDTGVSHVGAALGKQVVTIFSSAEPRWLAPYGNGKWVVENDVCPHRPCFDRCVMPSWICLDAVHPDLVVQKLNLLEESASPDGVGSRSDVEAVN